jgi:protein required for attachment to host cells
MNMNSLIIVADAARARLFRTAKTGDVEAAIELVEIEALDASRWRGESNRAEAQASPSSASDDEVVQFARQVAGRAAQFAHYHFCNPVIIVASLPLSTAMFAELERELPNAHVRRVTGDMAQLPPRELMRQLQARAAFTPLPARTPGQIEL